MDNKAIIWVGTETPPFMVSVGMEPVILLPDEETQRKGFIHERADLLRKVDDNWKVFLGKTVEEVT